jgi:predicted HTH transcriptional regulator
MEQITFTFYILIGFLAYILIILRKERKDEEFCDSFFEAGKLIKEKKRRSLDKIMNLLEKTGRIKNDDVQDLLDIADSTATNYLEDLERAGLIEQQGESGRGVYYTKK